MSSNDINTGKTLGGKPILIDTYGAFYRQGDGNNRNGTIAGLQEDYEARLVEEQEAKDRAKARRNRRPLPVHVLRFGALLPAEFRGLDQRSGDKLLTVEGEKTNSRGIRVLRSLTDAEVAEFAVVDDAWKAAEQAMTDAYDKGVEVERWSLHAIRQDDGWTFNVLPYQGYLSRGNAVAVEPVTTVEVIFDGARFAAPSLGLTADRFLNLQFDVLAAVHPHHGDPIMNTSGTVKNYDANQSYDNGVLASSIDVDAYQALVEARRAANEARNAWLDDHAFEVPEAWWG